MLIFVIDDERIALMELCETIQSAVSDARIESFTDPFKALEQIRSYNARPDAVFSDIRMPGMDGLELAVRIKTISPDTEIVFVTGYSDYALRAFKVHASGYLMKPVTPEQVTEELDNLRLMPSHDPEKLRVQCFGNFEVFWKDKPLSFKRRRTKELFAYLIDRNGASCSAEEVIAVLWEDENDMTRAKHNLRNLTADLRAVLKEIDQGSVLIRGSGTAAIDRTKVDCDYFRMLDGDMTAVNAFRGEYMTQYSWAQVTEGKLHFNH